MATDDERRRVAVALRRADAERLDRVYGNVPVHAHLTLGLVADAAELHYAPYEFTAVELRNRLADLIDPGDTSQGCRDAVACDPTERGIDSIYEWCRERLEGADGAEDYLYCSIMSAIDDWSHPERATVRTARPVDRDALLELADEMDRDGRIQREREKDGQRWFIDGLDIRDYARRIREACGEVE